jgi:hypothetical protein
MMHSKHMMTIQPDYIVFKSGSNYIAENNAGVQTQNASFGALINGLDSALSSTGGSIFIKKGTYNCGPTTRPDLFSNNIRITGAGKGLTILKRTFTSNDTTIKLHGTNNIVEHLTIDGDYPNSPVNSFGELGIDGADNIIRDVEFKRWWWTAVGHNNVTGTKYLNCVLTGVVGNTTLSDPSSYGIFHNQGTANQYTEIRGCRFSWCGRGAIAAEGVTVIDDCYFSDNAVEGGGQLGPGSGGVLTIITNCHIRSGNTGSSGIEIGYGTGIIKGNLIENMHNWGIVTNANVVVPGLVISDNVVKNCPEGGIVLQGAQKHFIIKGNQCYDDKVSHVQKYGIAIPSSSSSDYIVENNICYNNTITQIQDLGTGTKVVKDNITT